MTNFKTDLDLDYSNENDGGHSEFETITAFEIIAAIALLTVTIAIFYISAVM